MIPSAKSECPDKTATRFDMPTSLNIPIILKENERAYHTPYG
jgi:hypothetical protein